MYEDHDDCLDSRQGGCEGEAYPRPALSGSGLTYVRCEKHFQDYLGRVGPKIAETRRRYPDSDTPPGWFDAGYAGEQWNDD